MREISRLDKFYEKFCSLHKEYLSDWRFGQLICNFFGWYAAQTKCDVFFVEEDDMIEWFERYVEEMMAND